MSLKSERPSTYYIDITETQLFQLMAMMKVMNCKKDIITSGMP